MLVQLLTPKSIAPKRARVGDAGLDVYSPISTSIRPGKREQIKLGIAVEVAEDEVVLMQERSGMAIKHGVRSLGNVIDSNYRGEISIILHNGGDQQFNILAGDRIGQMLVLKLGSSEVRVVPELSTNSERGTAAHYSSGI